MYAASVVVTIMLLLQIFIEQLVLFPHLWQLLTVRLLLYKVEFW
jgi:hypothetical protein